mgnify:CR=1 FL=1
MKTFYIILILITMVSLSDVIRRLLPFKMPLPLMQIIMGAAIAFPSFGLQVEFDPDLFLFLFIPPLLFADGRRMPFHEFVESRWEIISLAMFLVFVTVIGLGFFIPTLMPDVPLMVAFALAAVLSPTDAVALSGIVGKGRLPKRINKVLEGEALLNDASALVSLKYAVAIIMGTMVFKTSKDYAEMGVNFLLMAGGGVLIGFGVTWFYVRLVRVLARLKGDETAIQMIFLLLLPFLVYVVAEHVGASGILAAVVAGMTVTYSNTMSSVSIEMRFQANSIWTVLEYLLNGIVFLMLGLQIPSIIEYSIERIAADNGVDLVGLVSDIFIIYGMLMLVRFLWLLAMKHLKKILFLKKGLAFEHFTVKELLIMTFAGVRGAVTLAAALSIPWYISTSPTYISVPARYQVTFIAIGVILTSLLVAIVILPLLLKGFTLDNSDVEQEVKVAKAAMQQVALSSIQTLENRLVQNNELKLDPQHITDIHNLVARNIRQSLGISDAETAYYDSLELRFRLAAIRAERAELMRLKSTRQISEETANKLRYDIDLLEKILAGREQKH